MGLGNKFRTRCGRSDIWLIGGVTLGLMFATILVVMRLVDQTDAHVKRVSKTRVKLNQNRSPNLNEVERQIASELKHNPNATKGSYSGFTLTKRSLKYIKKMSKMNNLDLADAEFENEWLALITNLPLTKLILSGTHLNDEGLKYIGQITTLNRLVVSQTSCTDAGVKKLLPLQSLEQLNVRETKIGDESIEVCAGLKALWLLDIADTKVTAAGVAKLPKIKKLTELYLGSTPLNANQLKPLRDCKQLSFVQLDNCGIGDAELAEFVSIPSLKKVHLFTNKITAKGLKAVAAAKNITLFKFTNDTKIPNTAIDELIKTRPGVEVEVKGPSALPDAL